MSFKRYTWGFITLIASFLVLAGCTNQPGETRTFADIEFQWCPSGTFVMGSPEDEEDRWEDETRHVVTLTHGFWLGKYEVTQAQWEAVMGDNPSEFPGDDLPVENVSWEDVQEFLGELNANDPDMYFRLPTESEWEYACRAGATTRFYWGEDPDETGIDDYAWYIDNTDWQNGPRQVGQKLPNDWGLYDMSGNAAEWCNDLYGEYPTDPIADPTGPNANYMSMGVLRGGWLAGGTPRSAVRTVFPQDISHYLFGFRVVRDP